MIKLLSLADVITLTNAVFGFLAILLAASGQLWFAAVFIFLGLLADGLDGYVARRFGAGTLGEYFESLADMLSLSVAPLLLVYATFKGTLPSEGVELPLFSVVLIFSLGCSLLRLSSFSQLKDPHWFLGLPTSVSALFLVTLSILTPDPLIVALAVILLGLLMVSSIRFPKPGIKLNTVTALLIILVILFHEAASIVMVYILLLALILYVIAGPLYLRMRQRPYEKTA